MDYSDIVLELTRLEREAIAAITAKMARQQLGQAWIGLVDDRGPDEGDLLLAA
jgi:hypothetical protein